MGMDVYGRSPSSEAGEYFRSSVWWWHPLAKSVQKVDPETTARCQCWHTNDGDGLDARDSEVLVDALQRAIDSGETAQYEDAYERKRAARPRNDFNRNYYFSAENVQRFANFLRHSGGFNIL